MSKSSLHVAFDAQLALLDNSLSRYVRNVVRQLVEVAPEFRISLLVFSPRTAELIRAEQPWIPEHVELVVMPGAETPHHLARQERLRRYYLATAWKLREIGADIYQGHYTNFPFPWRYRVVTIVHDQTAKNCRFRYRKHHALPEPPKVDSILEILLSRNSPHLWVILLPGAAAAPAGVFRYIQ